MSRTKALLIHTHTQRTIYKCQELKTAYSHTSVECLSELDAEMNPRIQPPKFKSWTKLPELRQDAAGLHFVVRSTATSYSPSLATPTPNLRGSLDLLHLEMPPVFDLSAGLL